MAITREEFLVTIYCLFYHNNFWHQNTFNLFYIILLAKYNQLHLRQKLWNKHFSSKWNSISWFSLLNAVLVMYGTFKSVNKGVHKCLLKAFESRSSKGRTFSAFNNIHTIVRPIQFLDMIHRWEYLKMIEN